ncbi:MAG: adventurous gliding motility protein CglE [Archangiaceae bacterium]|nr:adventurous gliding motility protein CglE [Archangiaceae bacterium]
MRKLAIVSLLLLPLVASAEGSAQDSAPAKTPQEGVPLKVRRGFFTETDVGGFLTLGGDNAYSNLQIYLQLGVGYDITEHLELGLHVGIGANAANCYAGLDSHDVCTTSDNFTVTFIDVSFAYLFRIAERFYIAPKIVGGLTLLDPVPDLSGSTLRPNVGAAIGIEYATNMDHFTIGLDIVLGRFIIGPNIFSMQFFPRVKYTF